MTQHRKAHGFTISELAIVIVIIGVLAGLTVVGYGTWRRTIAESEVKSDLSGVASAMDSVRNFDNEYPTAIPSTFTGSEGVVLAYVWGNSWAYCVNAYSISTPSVRYFLDTANGNKEAKKGTCQGGQDDVFPPAQSGGLIAWKRLDAGDVSTLTIGSNGTVYAWGSNQARGLLGNNNSPTTSRVPVAVYTTGTPMAGKEIVQVSASPSHGMALASDGSVYTWGQNTYGALGNGTTSNYSLVPVAVTTTGTPMAGKQIVQIAAGDGFSLALDQDGVVYSWGRNTAGQLGIGSQTGTTLPGTVDASGTPMAGKRVSYIAAGDFHAIVSDSNGTVYTWGSNTTGVLGDDTTTMRTKPIAVVTTGTPMAGKKITWVGGSYSRSLAIDSNGSLYTWGSNNYGSLGIGETGTRRTPVAVVTAGTPMAGKKIIQATAGTDHTHALASDGTVYSWGFNNVGQLGDGTANYSLLPISVTTAGTPMAGKTIVNITASTSNSAYAMASDGKIYAWGSNSGGYLGNDSSSNSAVPVEVSPTYYP